ncbi:MAG: DJ-1 family glyoxalase III [Campylobacterota bacterium]|nr:DJ-1 family glyoxalase III [Campylobacterota bacterium]
MSKVLVPLAIGFEEIEAVTIIDVLRRAGIQVIVAAVSSEITVQGANGIIVKADTYLSDVDEESLDMIVLPGGWGGTDVLAVDETVQSIIKTMNKRNKFIGAICAAPFALDKAGVLPNKFTCYPSVEEKIDNDGYICDQSVVEQGNIITSRGPGTSICFALEIVKKLKGEEIYTELRSGLLAQFC